SRKPEASLDEVAREAGVSRQTVYAHYSSRDALLEAVQNRALEQATAAIDAADTATGPPAEALDRLIVAGWETLERHARLLETLMMRVDPEQLHDLHAPIGDRLEALIRRGQRDGVFDRKLKPSWLVAATLGLFHASAQEVGAGRMAADDAVKTLRRTLPRV